MVDPYTLVACVVALVIFPMGNRGGVAGTVLVALIWPVLVPVGLYFAVKTKLLKLPFRSDWVLPLELAGCLCATALACVLYLLNSGV